MVSVCLSRLMSLAHGNRVFERTAASLLPFPLMLDQVPTGQESQLNCPVYTQRGVLIPIRPQCSKSEKMQRGEFIGRRVNSYKLGEHESQRRRFSCLLLLPGSLFTQTI